MPHRRGVLIPALIVIPVGIGVGLAWAALGGEESAWHLALEPEGSWTLPYAEAPVLAAALSPGRLAVVPPDRQRVILFGGDERREVDGFGMSEVSALATEPGRVWIAAGRSIYAIETEDLEVREWHGFDGGGEILAMTHAPGRLWLVHGELGFAWLSVLALNRGADPEPLGRIDLPSPQVSLHGLAGGGVLVQDRLAPYTLRKVDEDLSEAWAVVPEGAAMREFDPDPASWTVLAALPIAQRGLVVQWFADLRSTARAAVLLNVERGEVERVRIVDAPLGLIHAFEGGTRVLGAQEVPEGRELVVFRVELAPEG